MRKSLNPSGNLLGITNFSIFSEQFTHFQGSYIIINNTIKILILNSYMYIRVSLKTVRID